MGSAQTRRLELVLLVNIADGPMLLHERRRSAAKRMDSIETDAKIGRQRGYQGQHKRRNGFSAPLDAHSYPLRTRFYRRLACSNTMLLVFRASSLSRTIKTSA